MCVRACVFVSFIYKNIITYFFIIIIIIIFIIIIIIIIIIIVIIIIIIIIIYECIYVYPSVSKRNSFSSIIIIVRSFQNLIYKNKFNLAVRLNKIINKEKCHYT